MAKKKTKKATKQKTTKQKTAKQKTAKRKSAKRKTAKRALPRAARVPASAAAAEASVPVIEVPAGGTLDVIVDVGPMVFPYTIAYNGHTVIKAMVDQSERVPLEPGSLILSWNFVHDAKRHWEHDLGYSVNGGPVKVLDKKSAANGDSPKSDGIALVRS